VAFKAALNEDGTNVLFEELNFRLRQFGPTRTLAGGRRRGHELTQENEDDDTMSHGSSNQLDVV
jgi:hypothetical protein